MTKTKMIPAVATRTLEAGFRCPTCRRRSRPLTEREIKRKTHRKGVRYELRHVYDCPVFWDGKYNRRQGVSHSGDASPALKASLGALLSF